MDARPTPGSRPARLTIPPVESGPLPIGQGRGPASTGGAAFGLRRGAR
jgi:hypothetical protein